MSPIASKEEPEKPLWGFTCSECHWVPPSRDEEPDYASFVRHYVGSTPVWGSIALHVPQRCTECDTRKKRWSRMKRRVKAVYDAAHEMPGRRYRRPKFLTFGLPTGPSPRWEDREVLRRRLESRLPRARERLMEELGVKGGVYVIEMTSRLLPLRTVPVPTTGRSGHWMLWEKQPIGWWKHHPHVHMVVVAPHIKPENMAEACGVLTPMGLGRINLRALSSDTHKRAEAEKAVARYVAKYLNKDGGRLRSFGVLRKR